VALKVHHNSLAIGLITYSKVIITNKGYNIPMNTIPAIGHKFIKEFLEES
jgi:hypothetical protein